MTENIGMIKPFTLLATLLLIVITGKQRDTANELLRRVLDSRQVFGACTELHAAISAHLDKEKQ